MDVPTLLINLFPFFIDRSLLFPSSQARGPIRKALLLFLVVSLYILAGEFTHLALSRRGLKVWLSTRRAENKSVTQTAFIGD
jgi:hypothetical protein